MLSDFVVYTFNSETCIKSTSKYFTTKKNFLLTLPLGKEDAVLLISIQNIIVDFQLMALLLSNVRELNLAKSFDNHKHLKNASWTTKNPSSYPGGD